MIFNAYIKTQRLCGRPEQMSIRGSARKLADCVYARKAIVSRINDCPAVSHGFAFRASATERRTIFGNYRFKITVSFATVIPEKFYEIVWGHIYSAAVLTFGLLGVQWTAMRQTSCKITVAERFKGSPGYRGTPGYEGTRAVEMTGSDVYRAEGEIALTKRGLVKLAAEVQREDK